METYEELNKLSLLKLRKVCGERGVVQRGLKGDLIGRLLEDNKTKEEEKNKKVAQSTNSVEPTPSTAAASSPESASTTASGKRTSSTAGGEHTEQPSSKKGRTEEATDGPAAQDAVAGDSSGDGPGEPPSPPLKMAKTEPAASTEGPSKPVPKANEEEIAEQIVKRARSDEASVVQDVLIAYPGDTADDPPPLRLVKVGKMLEPGETYDRQSAEIDKLFPESPIAKRHRQKYNWVAQAKGGKFTRNPDMKAMFQKGKELAGKSPCDVCGSTCSEHMYVFRGYLRKEHLGNATGPRVLDPFVAYISERCGNGLLGVRSEGTKLRERLYQVINEEGDAAVETLKELWKTASKAQQKIIMEELRQLAGVEIGETDRALERRNVEKMYGTLNKSPEDLFRAAARYLGPVLGARDLAAATVQHAKKDGVQLQGYIKEVAHRLKKREPVPDAPKGWQKADLEQTIRHFVAAWPVRVELMDSLGKKDTFIPETVDPEELRATLKFVYMVGNGELRSFAGQKLDKEVQQKLRAPVNGVLRKCKEKYSAMEAHMVQHGHRKKEDEILEIPDGSIEPDHVRKALESITWPACTTRGNVNPEGTTFINAFPLGIVNNYAFGLMCSRPTTIRPNLTKLMTKFLAQSHPDFTYTTIQLNRDYSARMHVDGNNFGPSYIMAMGDYTGGDLWIYDEDGDYEVDLKEPMRGWSHLKVGQRLKGKLHNIKDRWFYFDGTIPHMAMPFKGHRLSIVYFCRKGWTSMKPEVVDDLKKYGFVIPRAEQTAIVREQGKVVSGTTAGTSVESLVEEEEEVDEAESTDGEEGQELNWSAQDWAERFSRHFDISWPSAEDDSAAGKSAASIIEPFSLVACQSGLGSVALALAALVPDGRCKVDCVCESDPGALKFARANCRAEHAFGDLRDFLCGSGFCDVHHRVCKTAPAGAHGDSSEVLVGSCLGQPFVNRDPSKNRLQLSCYNDPRADSFWMFQRLVAERRPKVALLDIRGFDFMPRTEQLGVLVFLLGKGVREGEGLAKKCLGELEGYTREVVELSAGNFGLPLGQSHTFIVLVRDDSGREAAQVAAITRALGCGVLPRVTLQDVLLENSHPKVLSILGHWKRLVRGKNLQDGKDAKAMQKVFLTETKDLKLRAGEAPYYELLYNKLGKGIADWFPHATPLQKTYLNLAYERTRQAGLDTDTLVVDMAQNYKHKPWRDDGILPAPGDVDAVGMRYSFLRHRPLTGVEELLCRGVPATELDCRGLDDAELVRLAPSAMPVPMAGALLCGVLLGTDLGERCGLVIPPGKLADVMRLTPPPPNALTIASLGQRVKEAEAAAAAAAGDAGQVQFEGRAAALLSLASHGAFGEDLDDENNQGKVSDAAKALQSTLAKVAEEDGEPAGSNPDRDAAADAAEQPAAREPRDWPGRFRALKNQIEPPSLDAAARWTREAAEDPQAELSIELLSEGAKYLVKSLSESRAVPRSLSDQRADLLSSLKEAGRHAECADLGEAFRLARYLQELDASSPRLAVVPQTEATMPKFVGDILTKGVTSWPMRRGFMEHLAAALQNSWSSSLFTKYGGIGLLKTWFREAPESLDDGWPEAVSTLGALVVLEPAGEMLPMLRNMSDRIKDSSSKARYIERVENAMVNRIRQELRDVGVLQEAKWAVPQTLSDFAAATEGLPGTRFGVTIKLLETARSTLVESSVTSSRTVAQWQKARDAFDFGVEEVFRAAACLQDGPWVRLTQVEVRVRKAANGIFDEKTQEIVQRDKSNEQIAAAQAEKAKIDDVIQKAKDLKKKVESGLKGSDHQLLTDLAAALQEIRTSQSMVAGDPDVEDALEVGDKAFKRLCQKPERHARARRWLSNHGLGCSAGLLQTKGLLDQLGELPDRFDQQLPPEWTSIGLPPRVLRVLTSALNSGALTKKEFLIDEDDVPQGWQRKPSRSVGHSYFVNQKSPTRTQWLWPSASTPLERIREPPEPKRSGKPVQGCARYVEKSRTDDTLRCLLCDCVASPKDHFSSEAHQQALVNWRMLREVLQSLRCSFFEELKDELSGKSQDTSGHAGLALAWFSELSGALANSLATHSAQCIFWHCVVMPHMPASISIGPAGIMAAFKVMLEAARAEEPGPAPPKAAPQPVSTDKAEGAARSLRALLTRDASGLWSLREDKNSERALGAVQVLKAEVAKHGTSVPSSVKDAIVEGQTALTRLFERPARVVNARKWLRRHGWGHCADLFAAHDLLDNLLQVAENQKLALGIGLPPRCLDALGAAFAGDWLVEDDIAPCTPANGWEARKSQSVGIVCFRQANGTQRQWQWPTTQDSFIESFAEPPAPPASVLRAESRDAVQAKLLTFTDKLDKLVNSFRHSLGPQAEARPKAHVALYKVWRFELRAILSPEHDANGTADGRADSLALAPVECSFWHKLVKPKLAAVEQAGHAPKTMLAKLEETLQGARVACSAGGAS